MRTQKIIEKKQFVIDEILCNICRQNCINLSNSNEIDGIHGYMEINKLASWDTWEFDICRKCLEDKIFPMFAIPLTSDEED